MLPKRLRRTYQEMDMPEGEESSTTHSSSKNLSSHDEPASPSVHQLMPDQDRAMDNFMVDWHGAHEEDDMADVPPFEEARPPHPQPTPQGQREWAEAEGHARTPIYKGARLSRLAAILGLLNI